MDNLFAKIDDYSTALWIETATLIVAMSLVFILATNIF